MQRLKAKLWMALLKLGWPKLKQNIKEFLYNLRHLFQRNQRQNTYFFCGLTLLVGVFLGIYLSFVQKGQPSSQIKENKQSSAESILPTTEESTPIPSYEEAFPAPSRAKEQTPRGRKLEAQPISKEERRALDNKSKAANSAMQDMFRSSPSEE